MLKKKNPTERKKKVKRERVIDIEVKQKSTGRHSTDRGRPDVVSKSAPPLLCVPAYHYDSRWLKTGILFTRSVVKKTNLLIHTS